VTSTTSRRLLVLAALLPLGGCALPPLTPPTPPAPEPPKPVLASLAAFATVRFFDPASRQAVLETAGGAVLDMTASPEVRRFGTIRQGARVVVEYEANGIVRIAPAARLTRADAAGRLRATVREVAVGGGSMVLSAPGRDEQEVVLRNPPMMAFATRLRPGDEVAVSVAPE
jgi:hypothetical protein